MLFFAFARIVFLLYYIRFLRIDDAGFLETAAGFYHALILDLATASYFMVVPFVILLIQSFWSPKFLNTINKTYTALMILVYSLITGGELGLYEEWKTKLNYKAIKYLSHPTEIYESTSAGTFFTLVIIVIILFLFSFWIYRRYFYSNQVRVKRNIIFSLLFLLLTPPLMLVSMRGGIQQIPVNQSESYYSDKNILNLAATNNAFNLYISLFENMKNFGKNPFLYYDMDEATETVKKIYEIPKDTTIHILTTKRPNIVLLLLESWSADLIESLGGEPGITPEFRKLEQGGILFDNILSSGSRSEQGIASLFGGFPAHPISSITVQPDKFVHLPSIIHIFNKLGYSTSFTFGGQIIYGNIKGYIIYNKFQNIVEIYNFADSVPRGRLGVHDEFTLGRLFHDLNNEKEPFFSALFTLSSHSPYDQPMEDVFDWGGNENRYINSAYYCDRSLGEFFKKARTTPWYDSTLFILVSDHSHNSYRNWPYHTGEYHRIVMLFYGNVIRKEFQGTKCHKPCSQVDIPATILAQMDLPYDKFKWSRNLFNPYEPDFKYFGFDDGLIWIEPAGKFIYDHGIDTYYLIDIPEQSRDSVIRNGKSYLQVLFQEYMDY